MMSPGDKKSRSISRLYKMFGLIFPLTHHKIMIIMFESIGKRNHSPCGERRKVKYQEDLPLLTHDYR